MLNNSNPNNSLGPSSNQASANKDISSPSPLDIYAMPEKFASGGHKVAKSSGSGSKIFLIATLLILLVVGGVAGALWYLNVNLQGQSNTVTNTSNNQNTVSNTVSNVASNTVENSVATSTDNLPTNDPSNEQNPVTPTSTPIVLNLDEDQDGLTLDEELLFSTNNARDDSDRDGYKDGQEVGSLFNPLVPSQPLASSGLVFLYTNNNFAYSVLLPSSWVPSATKVDNSEVIFLSNTETGEFIIFKTMANTGAQSLSDLSNSFFSSTEQKENYSLGGQPALRSKNKVLMVTTDFIYEGEYQVGPDSVAHFPTVWEMILKSFQVTKASSQVTP